MTSFGDELQYLPYPFPCGKRPAPHMKQVALWVGYPEGDAAMGYASSLDSVREWWRRVEALATTLTDPVLNKGGDLVGWRPMTEAERRRSDAARERAKKAAEKRRLSKEKAERAQLERLQAKYGTGA